jgi:SAM-dependent methyltransferase
MDAYVLHLVHERGYQEAARRAEGKRVLDWGCNHGYGMAIVRPHAASVSGIDVAPHAVEAARERFGPDGPHVELYDGVRSAYPDGAFDLITCFQLIEHLPDYEDFFAEVTRVLAPDGTVLITTPNGAHRLNPGMGPWNEYHVTEFTPDELRALLEQHFDDVEILGLDGDPELMAIHRRRTERGKAAQRLQARPKLVQLTVRALRKAGRTSRRLVDRVKGRSEPGQLAPEELARFSIADLDFDTECLGETLDLLAVCRRPKR